MNKDKEKTLKEAILNMVETYKELKCKFSIYDVTSDIREAINNDIFYIDDLPFEDIDRGDETIHSQFVSHDVVKQGFTNIYKQGELNLEQVQSYPYRIFLDKDVANKHSNDPIKKTRKTKFSFHLLEEYLNGRSDDTASVKQIQSRFKNSGLTCQEIYDKIVNEIAAYNLSCYEVYPEKNVSKTKIKLVV